MACGVTLGLTAVHYRNEFLLLMRKLTGIDFPGFTHREHFLVAGTMTGSEIAIALFVHPRLSRLDDAVHVRAVQALAIGLGAAMPYWYALTCLSTLATTIFAHTEWTTPRWLAFSASWRASWARAFWSAD